MPYSTMFPNKPFFGNGNIDTANRPIINNPDGSISTLRSITVESGGKYIVLPTVKPDGSGYWSTKEAFKHYRKTNQNLGVFDTQEEADTYARGLHEMQDRIMKDREQLNTGGQNIPVVLQNLISGGNGSFANIIKSIINGK